MPRKVFESLEDLREWIKTWVTPDRYAVNVTTREREVIVEPTKSTRPVIYGYYKCSEEELEKFKEFLKGIRSLGYSVIKLKSYEWDVDKSPGVRVAVEREDDEA